MHFERKRRLAGEDSPCVKDGPPCQEEIGWGGPSLCEGLSILPRTLRLLKFSIRVAGRVKP